MKVEVRPKRLSQAEHGWQRWAPEAWDWSGAHVRMGNASATAAALVGLAPDLTYFAKVRASAQSGYATESDAAAFRTSARPSLIPCLCTRFTRAGIEWRR